MKKKYIYYALLPVLAFSLAGAGAASAHGMFGFGSTLAPEELASRQQAMFQDQADLLGLSADEIKAGWAQGKSFQEIAKAHDITPADLQKKMQAKRQAEVVSQLKTLVAKGVITQAQADKRAEFMAKIPTQKFKGHGMGHMFGAWR